MNTSIRAPNRLVGRSDVPVLTSLRFFAAIYVVIYHFGTQALSTTPSVVQNFIGHGYAAVSFFFMLSGYILAHNYLDDVGARSTSSSAGSGRRCQTEPTPGKNRHQAILADRLPLFHG